MVNIKGTSKINIKKPLSKSADDLAEKLIVAAETGNLKEGTVGAEGKNNIKAKAAEKFKQIKTKALQAKSKLSEVLVKAQEIKTHNVGKARQIHPYVNKAITIMDNFMNYLTKPDNTEGRSEVIQYTRSPSVFGVWVTVITAVLLIFWGLFARVDSGAVAQGKIVLESQKRSIQSLEGGIIKKIYIKDGDHVKQGDLLVELDESVAKAKRDSFYNRYLTYLSEHARLISERDNLPTVKYPAELLNRAGDLEIAKIMGAQDRLKQARDEFIRGKIDVLNQNIKSFQERKKAYLAQKVSTERRIELAKEQLTARKNLLAKGNSTREQVNQIESMLTELEGKNGELLASLSEVDEKILQSTLEVNHAGVENAGKIAEELRRNQESLNQAEEYYKEAEEAYKHTKIYAPVSGVINNLMQFTEGGAVPHNGLILEIVPQNDLLVVDAQVLPNDIDVVGVGQEAKIRIAAFKSRVVPTLEGKVVSVSPDLVMPKHQNEMPHYSVRVEIDKSSLDKVMKEKGIELYPGMQAQVIIVLGI
jgi:HlyD family type I secretion membrane fusion protein